MIIQSKLWLIAAAFCAALVWSGPSMAAASSCAISKLGSGSKLLFELENSLTKPGNSATSNITVGGRNGFRNAALLLVEVWASADYKPPNPTWFFTTIKTTYNGGPSYYKNKIVAREDSYRDGNAQVLKFDNSLSYSEPLPKNLPINLSIEAVAKGYGAAGVKNTTLCIAIRVISLD
jgi:hypothetical protein